MVDKFIRKNRKPIVSDKMAKVVSEYRRASLEEEVNAGRFSEPGRVEGGTDHDFIKTALGNVISNVDPFKKTASSDWRGSGGTVRQTPEVYSPLLLYSNLNLPRGRATINSWCRAFYALNPIVHNALNLHSTYPISKLNITCKDEKVLSFFEEMNEDIDLMNRCVEMALEYWSLGESVSAGTYLTLSDGSIKKIEDIQLGDYVLTHLGNKKKVIQKFIKPVKRLFNEKIKIYSIEAEGLPEPLIISGNHPMFITNAEQLQCTTPSCKRKNLRLWPDKDNCGNCQKKINKEINAEFIKTSDIKNNDIVYSSFDSLVVDDKTLTNEFCYFIGFWLAEGSYLKRNGKYIGVRVTQYDKDFIEKKIAPIIKDYMGTPGAVYMDRSPYDSFGKFGENVGRKCSFHYESKKRGGDKLAQWFLKNCGEYSSKKKISEVLMALPIEKQLNLLAGFIDGDGSVDISNGQISIITTSHDLANQFVLMLRRAGMHSTCSKRTDRELNGKKTKDIYRIKIITNEANNLFYDKLKTYKKELLFKTKWSCPRSAVIKNAQIFAIKSIEDITESFNDNFMYDIEVEDDHSYIANGIAVHNCFPYAELDESKGKWSRIIIQNPDYITVKHAVVAGDSVLSLRPDENLKRLVTSNRPSDVQQRQKLDPAILEHVKRGENIPLSNFYASHIARKINPYDTRGTGLTVSCFKQLMLIDQLREAKYAQAANLINPVTLIKVGSPDHNPNDVDLEHHRRIWEEAQYDRDFKIFTHQDVTVERIGASGSVIDINPDIQQLWKETYIGLMTPQILMDGGGDVTYANGGITLDVLKQRYTQFRNMLAQWLRKKIFAPISKIQGFYEKRDGRKVLIVPNVEWNHMSLFDAGDYIQLLLGLRTAEGKDVTLHTIYRSLGLDYEEEQRRKKLEAIQAAIAKKEEAALQTMSLIDLRTLGPDDPIVEPEETPVPGETTPGEAQGAPADLGSLDQGSPSSPNVPDLGSPGGIIPPPPPPGPPSLG